MFRQTTLMYGGPQSREMLRRASNVLVGMSVMEPFEVC